MMCLLFLLLEYGMLFAGGAGGENTAKASPLETYVAENSRVTVRGQVYQKEEKHKYQLIYLKKNEISYLIPADQAPDQIKQSNLKQSKSKQPKKRIRIKEKRILIQDSDFLEIPIGNEIEVTGTLAYFDQDRNPGNFDQQFYYRKQGIHGSVRARNIEVLSGNVSIPGEWLCKVRMSWKEMLHRVLGEEQGAVLSAIMLGDKSKMDPELSERFQKSGIGHILAISGLHMSFLGMGLYGLLRRRGMSFPAAGSIGILFLCLYTGMIGWSVSVIRALVMFIVRIGADLSGRVYDGPTSLSAAALVAVGIQPLYLLDAGFLLSFGAILGIQMVYPVLEGIWLPARPCLRSTGEKLPLYYKIKHTLVKSLLASLSIHMMILPIMLYFYFEFPPYSILLNLFVIPLMPWVLGAGIFGSVFWLIFPAAGTLLLKSSGLVLAWYELLCTQNSRLPLYRVVTGQPEKWKLVLYYTLLFGGLLLWERRKQVEREAKESIKKMRRVQGLTVLGLTTFLLLSLPERGLEVTMLDVGQGDCMFLQTKDFSCLIDGGSSDVGSVGKYRIEPFLKSQGIASLDLVFISHGDADHMNGIEEMLHRQEQGIQIQGLVLPDRSVWDERLETLAQSAFGQGTRVYTMRQGDVFRIDNLSFRCIQPETASTLTPGNEASMVLLTEYKAFAMLCTGDTEAAGETQLTQNLPREDYTVLKVAHHGSGNSTKEPFLTACSATYAFISAGRGNRYGHPHEETIRRLCEDGSSIRSTQEAGAVVLWTDGENVTVEQHQKAKYKRGNSRKTPR